MLAYFPSPYPDELLFSVLSRLADIMQYRRSSDLSRAIYGQARPSLSVHLPSYLDDVLAALPVGHGLTADQLIQDQTLFPFYQPFLPPARVQMLKAGMRAATPKQVHHCAGLAKRRVPEPKWLQFCHECLAEDQQAYGQGYWHRGHQVPGVGVCAKHGTILRQSQVSTYYRPFSQRYISIESALEKVQPALDNLSASTYQTLRQLAQDAAWLLQHRQPHITPESLRARFRLVLAEQGLAAYNGRLYVTEFMRAFQAHYSAELLSLLNCRVNYDNAYAWPPQTVNRDNMEAKHPLQYLLVIHFLGYRVETFFALPTQASYFGHSPWPCLNPVCDHYQQPVIETYQLDYQPVSARPRATFACRVCGFSYCRLGPDTCEADRYRLTRIVSRGPVWEARLQQLRADPTLSQAEIGRQLKIDSTTVAAYGIDQPDAGPDREKYRTLWLAALQRFPEAKVSELCGQPDLRHVYHWLVQNDKAWYKSHTRDGRKNRRLPSNTLRRQAIYRDRDRQNRDVQLAESVRLAAGQLLHQPGKPQQLTRTALCYALNHLSFQPKPQQFSLAAQTLQTVVEPYPAFVIRRLIWATRDCRQQGLALSRTALINHAGVNHFFKHPHQRTLGYQILAKLASLEGDDPALISTLLPAAQPEWPVLDAQLAQQVVNSAERLKGRPGYPLQVTVVTVGVELDQLELILRHLELLPQTAQALSQVVETDQLFVRRVLQWVMAHDPDCNNCRYRIQFVRLAGLQSYLNRPTLLNLIDDAFSSCQTHRSPSQLKPDIDWPARDKLLAPAVRKAADTLRNGVDPRRRVTRSAISKIIDAAQLLDVSTYALLLYHLSHLPETDRVLNQELETWEQFTQRRLAHIAQQFYDQGLRPTRKQLLSRVGAQALAASPLIQQTVSQLLTDLATLPSAQDVARQKRWADIDAQLWPLIEPAAKQLKAHTEPLVWVTKSAIGKHLGQEWLIEARLEKLPLTAAALAEVVETAEAFALRRIQGVEVIYRNQKLCPTRCQFIHTANVKRMVNRPGIQAAISAALQRLSSLPP